MRAGREAGNGLPCLLDQEWTSNRAQGYCRTVKFETEQLHFDGMS